MNIVSSYYTGNKPPCKISRGNKSAGILRVDRHRNIHDVRKLVCRNDLAAIIITF